MIQTLYEMEALQAKLVALRTEEKQLETRLFVVKNEIGDVERMLRGASPLRFAAPRPIAPVAVVYESNTLRNLDSIKSGLQAENIYLLPHTNGIVPWGQDLSKFPVVLYVVPVGSDYFDLNAVIASAKFNALQRVASDARIMPILIGRATARPMMERIKNEYRPTDNAIIITYNERVAPDEFQKILMNIANDARSFRYMNFDRPRTTALAGMSVMRQVPIIYDGRTIVFTPSSVERMIRSGMMPTAYNAQVVQPRVGVAVEDVIVIKRNGAGLNLTEYEAAARASGELLHVPRNAKIHFAIWDVSAADVERVKSSYVDPSRVHIVNLRPGYDQEQELVRNIFLIHASLARMAGAVPASPRAAPKKIAFIYREGLHSISKDVVRALSLGGFEVIAFGAQPPDLSGYDGIIAMVNGVRFQMPPNTYIETVRDTMLNGRQDIPIGIIIVNSVATSIESLGARDKAVDVRALVLKSREDGVWDYFNVIPAAAAMKKRM